MRAHINGKEAGGCTAVLSFPGVDNIERNNCEMCCNSYTERNGTGNGFD